MAGDLANRRLHPSAGGFLAFPQGYLAPQARAGSDPDTGRGVPRTRPDSVPLFRWKRGGRSQPRPQAEKRARGRLPEGPNPNGENEIGRAGVRECDVGIPRECGALCIRGQKATPGRTLAGAIRSSEGVAASWRASTSPLVVAAVPMAARRAAVPDSRPFRPLPHRVRLAVPDPAARSARRWYTFPALPRSARGFRPLKMSRLRW